MKKLTAAFVSILILLGAFTCGAVSIPEKTDGDYSYIILPDNTAQITRYNGKAEKVSVPKRLGGRKVKILGTSVFNGNNSIKKLKIAGYVEHISDYVAYCCNRLETVVIGDSVRTVWDNSFRNCPKLRKAVIGNGAEEIGENMFGNCPSLSEVSLGMSINCIDYGAFRECPSIKEVYYYGTKEAFERVRKTVNPVSEPILKAHYTFGNNPIPELKETSVRLKAGQCAKIKVKNASGNKITYQNSKPKTAIVKNGKVIALKKGTAEITVNVGLRRLIFRARVTSSPRLEKKSVTVRKNKTVKVNIKGKAKGVKISFKNTPLAKVLSKKTSSKLIIKGVGKGTSTLRIKVNGVSLNLRVKVN